MMAEDATLVRRVCNGEDDAFALLYRRHKQHVWELSLYMCARDHHEAEEATQETFLKAWRGLSRYAGRSSFKCWLLSICRNVCIDRLRRRPARTLQLDVLLDSGRGDEVGVLACRHDGLDRIALRGALSALPRDECEAWFLVDVLGCSSGEAARVVGVRAATTMRSRLARARAQIARALSEDQPERTAAPRVPEICGLYRSVAERAIVTANGTVAFASPFAWREGQLRLAALASSSGERAADLDLVSFFDRLEGQIPTPARMVAVVGGQSLLEAESWLARRPRWQLVCAPTHESWRAEARRLLADCQSCPSPHGPGQVLALLDAAEPFAWTYGPEGVPV